MIRGFKESVDDIESSREVESSENSSGYVDRTRRCGEGGDASGGGGDASGGVGRAPRVARVAMVEVLSAAMAAAFEAGDVEAARVACEAIGKLLALDVAGAEGKAVELAGRRRDGGR